jgi:hypothetical protein
VAPFRNQLAIPMAMMQRMSAAVLVSMRCSMEADQEPLTPRFSGLAAVQMGNRLDFVAVPAEIRRGATSSFAYSDGQPVVSNFEYECPCVVRESCTGGAMRRPVDGFVGLV